MAYDEILAERIRAILADQPNLIGKKMFGGIAYMLNGNMACGVNQDTLMVRVGPERYEGSLAMPHTRPFDMTGRPMKGWVVVEAEGCEMQADLEAWVAKGVEFALSLPPK